MRAYHANGFFSHTHAMTTHAMFAPYKSRVVSRGGLLLPLTYLPGTSVEKKITRPGNVSSIAPSRQRVDISLARVKPSPYVRLRVGKRSYRLSSTHSWQCQVTELSWVDRCGARIHRSTTENFCWDEIRPRDWLNVDVGIFGHAPSIILSTTGRVRAELRSCT